MKISNKDLQDCGFSIGLSASMDSLGKIVAKNWFGNSGKEKGVVYVLVGPDDECLKVGQTGKTLKKRWEDTFRTVEREAHGLDRSGTSEKNFQRLFSQYLLGKDFKIWFRKGGKKEVEFIPGKKVEVPLRHAEEVYFDRCFEPLIGIKLDARKTT